MFYSHFDERYPSPSFRGIHPSYSTNLIPSDFYLFGLLKKNLGCEYFRTDAEVPHCVLTWSHNLEADFYDADFDGLMYQWNKCLDKYGDYVVR
ncbi:mariner Mos1 transposase [Trichonephila clavipes]|nr:mariner Mos1 transposase [Trichonephila clavipes]